jgi:hypothetical protein
MLTKIGSRYNNIFFKPCSQRFASTFVNVGSDYELDDVSTPNKSCQEKELLV